MVRIDTSGRIVMELILSPLRLPVPPSRLRSRAEGLQSNEQRQGLQRVRIPQMLRPQMGRRRNPGDRTGADELEINRRKPQLGVVPLAVSPL